MKRQEFFHGAVVGLFDVVGEITGGQLVLAPVVSYALTADPLARTGIVRTIAAPLIDLDFAFHRREYLESDFY